MPFYPPLSLIALLGPCLLLSPSVVVSPLFQRSYPNPSIETVFSAVICDNTLTIGVVFNSASFFLYLSQFSTHHGNAMLALDSGPDALYCFRRDLLHEFKSQTHANDAQTSFNCDIFCKFINLYLTALEILMMILMSLKLTEWSS